MRWTVSRRKPPVGPRRQWPLSTVVDRAEPRIWHGTRDEAIATLRGLSLPGMRALNASWPPDRDAACLACLECKAAQETRIAWWRQRS